MRFAFRFNPSSLVLYRAGISCDGSLILIKTTQVKLNTWDGSALILPVLLFITYFLNDLSSLSGRRVKFKCLIFHFFSLGKFKYNNFRSLKHVK